DWRPGTRTGNRHSRARTQTGQSDALRASHTSPLSQPLVRPDERDQHASVADREPAPEPYPADLLAGGIERSAHAEQARKAEHPAEDGAEQERTPPVAARLALQLLVAGPDRLVQCLATLPHLGRLHGVESHAHDETAGYRGRQCASSRTRHLSPPTRTGEFP